jgi:Hypothetical glycosyl hydrolase family 15/Fibronectin type III domain
MSGADGMRRHWRLSLPWRLRDFVNRRFWVGAAAAVIVLLLLGAPVARAGTAGFGVSPSGRPLLQWLPEEIGSGPSTTFTQDQAVAVASRYDVIVAYPQAFAPYLGAMRAANPNLVVLAYMNGMFAASTQGSSYPSDWYSYDASGVQVQNASNNNYLMNPSSSGWVQNRVTACQNALAQSGYDGCMLDTLGVAPLTSGYCTALPVNPATGLTWTRSDWLAATTNLSQTVRSTVSPSLVVGNGLKDGPSLSESGVLFNGMDGGIAEAFLRSATQGSATYPTETTWQQHVNMLANAPKPIMAMTKVWSSPTSDQLSQWHTFSLASFLLGTNGSDYFYFSSSSAEKPVSVVPWTVDIGDPNGSYAAKDGVYQRPFTKGLVLVNPTTNAVTVPLSGSYQRMDGSSVSGSLTMAPDTGEILTAAPASAPGAPTNVTATGGDAQATVDFSPPTNDGGSPITSYTVTAADGANPAAGGQSATVDASATNATVTRLANGDSYTFTVTATNSVGTGPASAPSNAVVPQAAPVITIDTPSPSFAAVGSSYSYQLQASGGASPYAWTATAPLPPGLALSAGGLISGTPTAAGNYTFTASVTDSSNPAGSVSETFTLPVYTKASNGAGAETITPTNVAHASRNNTFTLTYTAPATGALWDGTLRITVPTGWTTPSISTTAPGHTTTTAGTVSTSKQVITITKLRLAPGDALTIAYGDTTNGTTGITVPSKITTYTFATKEASTASGTLTPISKSPTVALT